MCVTCTLKVVVVHRHPSWIGPIGCFSPLDVCMVPLCIMKASHQGRGFQVRSAGVLQQIGLRHSRSRWSLSGAEQYGECR